MTSQRPGVAPIDLTDQKSFSQNRESPFRQTARPGFVFHIELHAAKDLRGREERFHEFNLVHTRLEKEFAEVDQGGLRQTASPVEVVAPRLIGGHQQLLIAADVARQTARDRPQTPADPQALQHRVGH